MSRFPVKKSALFALAVLVSLLGLGRLSNILVAISVVLSGYLVNRLSDQKPQADDNQKPRVAVHWALLILTVVAIAFSAIVLSIQSAEKPVTTTALEQMAISQPSVKRQSGLPHVMALPTSYPHIPNQVIDVPRGGAKPFVTDSDAIKPTIRFVAKEYTTAKLAVDGATVETNWWPVGTERVLSVSGRQFRMKLAELDDKRARIVLSDRGDL
jgi:hypothetical protein